MKVLYVRNGILGKDHYIVSEIEITKALRDKGIDARLIVKGDKKSEESFIIPISVPFNKNRYLVFKLFFYLPVYVLKNNINVIVLDEKSVIPSISVILLKKLLKVKIILDVRTVPVEQTTLSLQQKTAYKIARLFLNGATYITKTTREMCENKYGLKFKQSSTYSSAVNEKIFNRDVEINLDKKIVNSLKSRFVMIYHGSITPNRNIEAIPDAINVLKDKIPNLLFLSISDNNEFLREYCRKNNLKIDKHIMYLDSAENSLMPQYIKLADIGIIPYSRIKWWEVSSPLKLMEYLSMEKPIIMSDIKAHLDVVPCDSDFVVYFNPDDKGQLPGKILYAYENINRLKLKAKKGREIILDNYTWSKQADKVISFLTGLNENYKPLSKISDKQFSTANPFS